MTIDRLFRLSFPLAGKPCQIDAWDGGRQAPNHTRLDVEVTHDGIVIFARGDTWCGVSSYNSIDGIAARELVLSLVGMAPGDTDADYFAEYSADQLAWATTYHDDLDGVRSDRYLDEESGEARADCSGFIAEDDDDGSYCQICAAHSSEHNEKEAT